MYKAIIRAKTGLLLGGVKTHTSIYFDTREDADNWARVIIATNIQSNRNPAREFTIETEGRIA